MFAYGGAGPLHAAQIASEIGIKTFYVFPESPVFSAAGCSSMNIEHLYERRIRPHNGTSFGEVLSASIQELKLRAQRDARGEGFDPARARISVVVEKPEGAVVELAGDGQNPQSAQQDISDAILRVTATLDSGQLSELPPSSAGPSDSPPKNREIYWSCGPRSTPVYALDALAPAKRLAGPVVIESAETTCVVPEDWQAEKDGFGAIRVTKA